MKTAMIVALSLFAAACGADDAEPPGELPAPRDPELPILVIDHLEQQELRGPTRAQDICECTTDACRVAWVRETIGCDVCVVVECSEPMCVCAACELEAAPEVGGKDRPVPEAERPTLLD